VDKILNLKIGFSFCITIYLNSLKLPLSDEGGHFSYIESC